MHRELSIFEELEREVEFLLRDFRELKRENEELKVVRVKINERLAEFEKLLDALNKKLQNILWKIKELEDDGTR